MADDGKPTGFWEGLIFGAVGLAVLLELLWPVLDDCLPPCPPGCTWNGGCAAPPATCTPGRPCPPRY